MAYRAPNSSTNWSNAAGFDQGTNTPTQHATTNVICTVGGLLTATYTAPNITNAATGVSVYITNKASSGSPTTLTATLQEAGVDTACTGSITLSDINIGWVQIRVNTPYVFTAVTAGRYRWKLTTNSGTVNIAADSGGTLGGYIAWDDRHVAPATNDNVIGAWNSLSSPITINMDGTQACGATAAFANTSRVITAAMIIGNGVTLDFDTTASTQLTAKGMVIVDNGGQYKKGSVGTPYPAAYTSTTIYDMAATGNAGLLCLPGGKAIMNGAPKSSTTLWKSKLVSGVGTAASPLVLADPVDWDVGDEILVSPTSGNATNYNETESRFIITKNSATSYVLSATSGGGEAAFTYAHSTDAWCINVQRNIIERGTSTSLMASWAFQAQSSAGNVDCDWVRFQNIDNSLFFGVVPTNFVAIGDNCACDYSVMYYGPNSGFNISGTTAQTYNGLVAYSTATSSAGANVYTTGAFIIGSAQNKNLVDCFVMQHGSNGFTGTANFVNTFTRCYAFSTNYANNVASAGGFSVSGGLNTYNDCEAHACRNRAIVANTVNGDRWNNAQIGTKGINQTTDITCTSALLSDITFTNCSFGSATLISGYTSMLLGSEIRFHELNTTDNNHRWYTVRGSAYSSGTGLSDTTCRSPGMAVKIAPEDSTNGFTWPFLISAEANTIVGWSGFLQKNTAYGTSVARVELWLPGSTSADDTFTLSNTTGTWQPVTLSANYTSSIDGLAEIRVVGITNTASAYLFIDDTYNAGDTTATYDKMAGLETWIDGKPSPVINPSQLSAAAILSASVADYTTAGTVGNQLKKLLTVAKFIGLK